MSFLILPNDKKNSTIRATCLVSLEHGDEDFLRDAVDEFLQFQDHDKVVHGSQVLASHDLFDVDLEQEQIHEFLLGQVQVRREEAQGRVSDVREMILDNGLDRDTREVFI